MDGCGIFYLNQISKKHIEKWTKWSNTVNFLASDFACGTRKQCEQFGSQGNMFSYANNNFSGCSQGTSPWEWEKLSEIPVLFLPRIIFAANICVCFCLTPIQTPWFCSWNTFLILCWTKSAEKSAIFVNVPSFLPMKSQFVQRNPWNPPFSTIFPMFFFPPEPGSPGSTGLPGLRRLLQHVKLPAAREERVT